MTEKVTYPKLEETPKIKELSEIKSLEKSAYKLWLEKKVYKNKIFNNLHEQIRFLEIEINNLEETVKIWQVIDKDIKLWKKHGR